MPGRRRNRLRGQGWAADRLRCAERGWAEAPALGTEPGRAGERSDAAAPVACGLGLWEIDLALGGTFTGEKRHVEKVANPHGMRPLGGDLNVPSQVYLLLFLRAFKISFRRIFKPAGASHDDQIKDSRFALLNNHVLENDFYICWLWCCDVLQLTININ